MLKAALEYLSSLTTAAAEPRPILPDDPRKARFVIGGLVTEIDQPAPPREHVARSLPDLIALANRFEAESNKVVVWFNEDEVVLVIDDDKHRIETAAVKLEKSSVWTTLERLADAKPWLNQKAFIRLLRLDLAGTGDQTTRLLAAVRQVSFENGSITSGRYAKDQESLGRTITSAVKSGVGEIPEEVTLDTLVYTTQGVAFKLPVHCSVEVEPSDGTFRFLPLPDELTRVQQQVMDAIRETLAEALTDGIPAYYGQP